MPHQAHQQSTEDELKIEEMNMAANSNDAIADEQLRFITCGSVDDGKSTLIGRLLFDAGCVYEDQLKSLETDSKKYGTQGNNIDFALLVDGLAAEREQGITIDVAYRYFATQKRKFIVADTPGHEQYTRNMATGASTAEAAIILIDARKGMLPQTRRHSFIVSLLGVRHVIVAINKMDLINFSETRFKEIENEYSEFSKSLSFESITIIPISAFSGDNVFYQSKNMTWYKGNTLIETLETINISPNNLDNHFSFPVQWVNRPNADFRGYAGTITNGVAKPGMRVVVLPGQQPATLSRLVSFDGDLSEAVAGQAITITTAEDIDISRGDVIVSADSNVDVSSVIESKIVWMAAKNFSREKEYLLKIGTRTVVSRLKNINHVIDIHSWDTRKAQTLEMNEIGLVTIEIQAPIACTKYELQRELGSFILIDRLSNETVALGVITNPTPLRGDESTSSDQINNRVDLLEIKNQPDFFEKWLGSGNERLSKSLARTITWRAIGTLVTFFVAWAFTNNIGVAFGISATEFAIKTALYYYHDKAWIKKQLREKMSKAQSPSQMNGDGI